MQVLIALLSLAPGQQVAVPQPFPAPVPGHYRWPSLPGYGAPSAFGRSVAAFLTGEQRCHTVTQRGEDLVMLYEPASYEAFCSLGVSAHDFDVWPGGGSAPDRDALFLVHDSGLSSCWIEGSPPQFQSRLEAAGAWVGATMVRCGDLDADGHADVVGVAGDRRTVLVRTAVGDGTWVETSFLAATTVRALELLRYLPGDRLSIAAVTLSGLDVYATGHESPDLFPAGTLLADYRAVDTEQNCIAVLRRPDQPLDRLAWVTQAADLQEQVVIVLDSLGFELPAALGSLDVVAGACGDGDGDGDQDLYLGLRSDQGVLALVNQTTAPTVADPATTFVPEELAGAQLLDLGGAGTPAPGNQAAPLLADLDGDGETDVFFPLQELDAVGFHFGPSLPTTELPLLPPENSITHDSLTVTLSCGTGASGPYADVTFQVEYHDLGLLVSPLDPTHYRVVVWHTSDYLDEFDPHAPHDVYLEAYLGPIQPITVRVPWDPSTDAKFACYVHVRPVHGDGGGGPLTPGPPLVTGFALDPAAAASIWMHPLWEEYTLDPLPLDTTGCPLSNTRIGALLLTRRTVLPDDEIPEE